MSCYFVKKSRFLRRKKILSNVPILSFHHVFLLSVHSFSPCPHFISGLAVFIQTRRGHQKSHYCVQRLVPGEVLITHTPTLPCVYSLLINPHPVSSIHFITNHFYTPQMLSARWESLNFTYY